MTALRNLWFLIVFSILGLTTLGQSDQLVLEKVKNAKIVTVKPGTWLRVWSGDGVAYKRGVLQEIRDSSIVLEGTEILLSDIEQIRIFSPYYLCGYGCAGPTVATGVIWFAVGAVNFLTGLRELGDADDGTRLAILLGGGFLDMVIGTGLMATSIIPWKLAHRDFDLERKWELSIRKAPTL